MACFADGKLSSHELCFANLPPVDTVSTNRACSRDKRKRSAGRGTLTCIGAEQSEQSELAYVLRPTTRPPPGESVRWGEPGPMDGWGVWPAGAFDVAVTPYGRAYIHDETLNRCELAGWWPCTKAERDELRASADGGSRIGPPASGYHGQPLDETRAKLVRRALGPVLDRLGARDGAGPAPLWLLGTLDLDLDGHGHAVRVYNVATADFAARGDADPGLSDRLYFLLRDNDGVLARVPFTSPGPIGEPDFAMDGAVVGTFDLDGDGVPELWIEVPYYEGVTWQIVRPVNGKLERLASYTCGT